MNFKMLICFGLFFGVATSPALGQESTPAAISYRKSLVQLQKVINDHFYIKDAGFYRENAYPPEGDANKFSFLWPLCTLLQADNEIERVDSLTGLVNRTLGIIQHYYDTAAPAPGYDSYIVKLGGGDRFYDDNQWIGIALMDAYFRTHNKHYLRLGEEIYRFMMTGYDTVTGGGLYWKEGDHSTKNTCSNGPGILLALQLYKATHEKTYLDTALLLYGWVNSKLQAPFGLYYDNLKTATGRIGKHFYSYNTGTMLQANVDLYALLRKPEYLKRAVHLAEVSSVYFCGSGKFRDGYWFSAVLLRGYQALLKIHPDRKYIAQFRKCTDDALMHDRNAMGLMGKDKAENLVNQGGMLEILARLSFLVPGSERTGQ